MSLLYVVTLASVGLAAVAILGGIVTIISSALRNRSERECKLQRDAILRRILESLDKPGWDLPLVTAVGQNPRIAIDLLSEMSELIRGENRDQVLQLYKKAGIERWLFRQLRFGRTEQRRLAAEALRLFPAGPTIAALTVALDDRDPEVRLTAALSLAQLDALPFVSTLVTKLVEPTRQQSLLLHRLIESIAVNRPYEVLELASGTLAQPFLRPIAITALAKAGHLELSKVIGNYILDSDPEVRAAALAGAASLGDFGAKDHVKAALADPVRFVRVRAIDAARRLELTELIPQLVPLLQDEDWWVRFRAGEALLELGYRVPGSEPGAVEGVATEEALAPTQRGAA
jgi:hypothetical protein